MQESIEIIRHRGVKIIVSDYSGLQGRAFVRCIHQHNAEIQALVDKGEKDIRFLTDVTDCIADREAVALLKETAKTNLPLTMKSAAVGVVGVQKVLLQAINVFSALETKPFATREEAMDWLAER